MWSLQSTYRDIKNQLNTALIEIVSGDLAHVALTDSKGALIHVEGSHPLHYFGFSQTVPALLKYFKLGPDEVIVTNDSAFGSPRLCDLNFITPIYRGKEVRAYAIAQVSLLGLLNTKKIFSSLKSDDEGYKIPPTPLDGGGAMEAALTNFLHPSGVTSAQLQKVFSECRSALNKLVSSFEVFEKKWGKGNVSAHLHALEDYTENLLKVSLHRFPDGEFSVSSTMNKAQEHEQGHLQTRVKIHGESFTVDFLGTSKASVHSLNMPYHTTLSACLWFFMSHLGEEIPINNGLLNAVAVEAPTGTIVNSTTSSATLGGYYQTSQIVLANLKNILKQALPREGEKCQVSPSLTLAFKTEDKLFVESWGAGSSAVAMRSGQACVKSDLHNVPVLAVENLEARLPVKMISQALRIVKEKAETQMGGRGLSLVLEVLAPLEICILSGQYRDQQEVMAASKGTAISLKNFQPRTLSAGDQIQVVTFNGYNLELE